MEDISLRSIQFLLIFGGKQKYDEEKYKGSTIPL